MIDGIRISDSYTGYGRDTVDVDLLKKVEIMKGPSSVEYGSDGLAGTIAYFTKDPEDLVKDGRYMSITTGYIEKNLPIFSGKYSDNDDTAVGCHKADDKPRNTKNNRRTTYVGATLAMR